MKLYYLDRKTYRNRTDKNFRVEIAKQFGDVYILPEGGTNELALKGTVEIPQRKGDNIIFTEDEFIKPDTTPEILATLKPRAKFITSTVVGLEPRVMGLGPIYATKNILEKTKSTLDDFDIIELNEAFASQSLAVLRELRLKEGDPRVNPNGGAIALGHPLGMSGARLITTAMIELEEQKKKRALCTLCIGVGQGMSCIIEMV